jgi:Asp-tRNA(Asn)/Glu-tRNA(Gln) amidotransferase A subunit family amidase
MDPDVAYAHDVMTVPASLAGLPAISIPAGVDEATGAPSRYHLACSRVCALNSASSTGLPLGLQLISPRGHEGVCHGSRLLFDLVTHCSGNTISQARCCSARRTWSAP